MTEADTAAVARIVGGNNSLHEQGVANLHDPALALGFFLAAALEHPDSWAWAGFCKYALGEFDAAVELYRKAPPSEANHNGIAGAISSSGRRRDALEYLLNHCPQPWSIETQMNIGVFAFGFGRWEWAWKLFQIRHEADLKLAHSLDDVRGRRVLLVPEAGNGDVLMSWRWAPMIAELAADAVVWMPPHLRRLIAAQGVGRMAEDSEVIRLTEPGSSKFGMRAIEADERVTVTVPIMDAGLLFSVMPSSIPCLDGYLKVPADAVARRKLTGVGKLRVGLCWQGSAHGVPEWLAIDRRRSMSLEMMAPILAVSGCEFYSLQMPDHHRDHPRLTRVLDQTCDYLDTAAVVSQLDLIITVDTSVAHLAGALGKPVWLLNRFDGCWRWGWEREFVWYSSLKQFRQASQGDWAPVVERVARALEALRAGRHRGQL